MNPDMVAWKAHKCDLVIHAINIGACGHNTVLSRQLMRDDGGDNDYQVNNLNFN